jgi:exonuclease III
MNPDNLRVGTINANGLRTKDRRRAMLRQFKSHADIICIQETFADGALMKDISFEFPGFWINSNARSHHSTGTAIGVFNVKSFKRQENDDYVDDDGRMAGLALKHSSGENFYILSLYAPCCDKSTQNENYAFLVKASLKMFEMRDKGYTILTGGDLSCLRDESIDARNGGEAFPQQQDWFNQLEASGNFFDIHRFNNPGVNLETWSHGKHNSLECFRRLDYFLAPRSILERVESIRTVPTLSYHRLLVMTIGRKRDKAKGIGMWRHNDRALNDEEYCSKIEDTIRQSLTEHDDPVIAW